VLKLAQGVMMARWAARQFFRSIGILAVYALVLQAALAAAAPCAIAAEEDAVAICLNGHAETTPTSGEKQPSPSPQHPCCLACALPFATAPSSAAVVDAAPIVERFAYRTHAISFSPRSDRSPRLSQGPPQQA